MVKVTYGPYCKCGDEQKDHFLGLYDCHARHTVMGPADNTDIDEIQCDCGEYSKEYDPEDDEEYPW